MPRSRNIKPSFFTNEILGTLDPIIPLLFAGLWCLADREGILEDRPMRIKAEIFPYRDNVDVNGYLTVLKLHKFIVRYEVDGNRYIKVVNFGKHQHPHHTEKSKGFPHPSGECVLTPLNNGDSPSDLLIPDLLIPECLPPTEVGKTGKPVCPPCPISEIVDLYHQTLPTLPRLQVRNETRDGYIRARWKQFFEEGDFKDREGGLACFRWLFEERVKPSKFLTGQSEGRTGQKPFVADLEWLMRPTNFAKVVENRYGNR